MRPPSETPGVALHRAIDAQTDRVTRLAWSPDGRLLALPSRDGVVRVHDAATGELRATLDGHGGAVMGVAWSSDGRTLASIGNDDRVRTWDAATGTPRQAIRCPEGSLTGIAWCPSGGVLAVTSESGCVLRWRERDDRGDGGESLERQDPLASPGALHAAWSPDGRRIAVGSRDGCVRVWDPWPGTLLAELAGHADAAVHVAWAPDGRSFATASKDGTIRLWDGAGARPLGVLDAHRDQVMAVAYRHDGTLFASKSRDGSVLLWRLEPWRVVAAIREQTAEIGWSVGLAFHPRDPRLATLGQRDRVVRIWDLDLGVLPIDGIALAAIAAAARPRAWPAPRGLAAPRRVRLS